MESQELNNEERFKGFAVGKHKVKSKTYSTKYFVKRIANETGYSQKDIQTVLVCLQKVFEDCLVDVSENDDASYTFGPFELYSVFIDRKGSWKNPRTGEIIHHVPHFKPKARIRSRYRKTFSITEQSRRELNGVDVDGTPINK